MLRTRYLSVAIFLISNAAAAFPFCDRASLKEDQADKDTCLAELKSKMPPTAMDRASNEAWIAALRLNISALAHEIKEPHK